MKTINIYTFNELNEKSRAHALDKTYVDSVYKTQDLKEYFENELKKIGFMNIEVYFEFDNFKNNGVCFDADISLYNLSKQFKLSEEHKSTLNEIFKIDRTVIVKFKSWIDEYIDSDCVDINFVNTHKLSDSQYTFLCKIIYSNYIANWLKITCKEFKFYKYEQVDYFNLDMYKIKYFKENEIYFLKNGEQLGNIKILKHKGIL